MALDINAIYGVNGVPAQNLGPDLGAIYGAAEKIQKFKQERAQQNALKSLFADPTNLGPDGMPNQNAMKRLMAVDPTTGFAVQKEEASISDARSLAAERQQKSALERDNYLNKGVREPAAAAYDQAIREGKTPEQAQDIAQKVYTDGLNETRRSGLFSDDVTGQFDSKFDIERVRQRIKLNAAHNSAVKGSDIETLIDQKTGITYDHDKITGTNRTMSGEAYTPSGEAHKIGGQGDVGGLSEKGVDYYAEQFRTLGPASLGRLSKPDRERVINRAAGEAGPDGAEGDIRTQFAGKGAQAEQRSLGTRTGQLVLAEREMEGAVKLSSTAYHKLTRDQFMPFNELRNLVEKKTSSPEQAAAYAADNAIVNIYARMISPTGQGTDSDKNHAREMLNQAQGPEAHEAVLNQLMAEGRNAAAKAHEAQAAVTSETPLAQRGAGGASMHGVADVSSKDEYDALPKGAHYRKRGDPPGQYRTKQ